MLWLLLILPLSGHALVLDYILFDTGIGMNALTTPGSNSRNIGHKMGVIYNAGLGYKNFKGFGFLLQGGYSYNKRKSFPNIVLDGSTYIRHVALLGQYHLRINHLIEPYFAAGGGVNFYKDETTSAASTLTSSGSQSFFRIVAGISYYPEHKSNIYFQTALQTTKFPFTNGQITTKRTLLSVLSTCGLRFYF